MHPNELKILPQFFPSFWSIEYQVFGIPFTEEISIGFVTRGEGGYSYLLIDEFENMNALPKDLLEISIVNLEEEFEDCEIKNYQIPGGNLVTWFSETDNFTAVRFLSEKYLTKLKKILGSNFRFSIPHRDLISCWSSLVENENLKFEQETIEDFNESEYNLSDKVYEFNEIVILK